MAPIPPPKYAGLFALEISSTIVRLREFRGCYEKTIGGELEDCHMTFSVLAPALLEWIADTLQQVHDAFVRDIAVSEFLSNGQQAGTITLIAVPRAIEIGAGGGQLPGALTGPTFRESGFSLQIGSDGIAVATRISSVHASRAKIAVQGPSGVEYVPGQPVFDDLQVEVAPAGAAALDGWVNDVRAGGDPHRSGDIFLFDQSLEAVGRVRLFDLAPIAFPPFGTAPDRRTILLDLGHFELASPCPPLTPQFTSVECPSAETPLRLRPFHRISQRMDCQLE